MERMGCGLKLMELKEAEILVVKVGTSTLTYENGKVNLRRIEELCRTLSDLQNAGRKLVLVSSGAIGVGMGKLGLPQRPEETEKKAWTVKNDPRVTGYGKFMRHTSIDELPQFWNILKGDMSLVGTRPPTMDEWEKYELHHRKRLAIKPGLTGMWQVSGRSDITDFEEVVELDTKYIAEWCLKLDIEILVKTVMVVFRGSGAK